MYNKNWDSNTELIIVTSHFTEDLEWLKQSKYPLVVCSKVGAHIPAIPADPKCIIPNIGNEASSYLKFIITYYDNLPEHIAFIHGHETSWHQSVDILKAIDGALYKTYNYISLNGIFLKRKNNTEFHELIQKIYKQYFESTIGVSYPKNSVQHDACAQFIVSRNTIKKYSKEIYSNWFNLIIDVELAKINGDQFCKTICTSSFIWGLIFEFIWHIIFGEPARLEHFEDYMETHFDCFPGEKRYLVLEKSDLPYFKNKSSVF